MSRFRQALDRFNKINFQKEKALVLSLYYDEELNLKEIGEVIRCQRISCQPDIEPIYAASAH